MSGALIRFRLIAYLVGVMLILLTIGVVLRYGFGQPEMSQTVSPIHGFLYMVYLVAVFDLGRRIDWSLKRMVLVMLAGTVPVMSFYAERVVTRRWVPARLDSPARADGAAQPDRPAPTMDGQRVR
jgi:integral membrane protein